MKNLIVARHGNYEEEVDNGKLTSEGTNQVITLARFMKEEFNGSFWLASSPLRRAVQSAIILRDDLEIDSGRILYELNCEYDGLFFRQAGAIHRAVEQRDEDNIVLMGHYATAMGYSKYVMKKKLSQQMDIKDVDMGQAIHINLEKGLYRIIPQ